MLAPTASPLVRRIAGGSVKTEVDGKSADTNRACTFYVLLEKYRKLLLFKYLP